MFYTFFDIPFFGGADESAMQERAGENTLWCSLSETRIGLACLLHLGISNIITIFVMREVLSFALLVCLNDVVGDVLSDSAFYLIRVQ